MMRFLTFVCCFQGLSTSCAFLMQHNPMQISYAVTTASSFRMAQVDLIPEPEGGQELIPLNTMDGTRVKLMEKVDSLTSDDGTVYKFWMQTVAKGELIQQFKVDILKESKKKVRKPSFIYSLNNNTTFLSIIYLICQIFLFHT
jgi:hypothetical protein